ncbi:MAG: glycosyltransferase family 4 protein [Acidobacteriota bacterium]|nr:glycosyltransferase family 4 protein [Acidobacteriota bacterium]
MIEKGRRVSVFNQAYGPHLREVACALAEAGAHCTVHTGRDWKAKGTFPERVVVIDAPPLNRKSVAGRFLSWLSYSVAATRYLLRCDRHDSVMLFSNPPILPFFGWVCSLVRGYRYSVFVYDIYPDVLTAMGMGKDNLLVRAWRRFNRTVYQRAFAVITIGNVMAAALARQFDPTRTSVGKVLVSRIWIDSQPAAIKPENKPVTVLFVGNVGMTHDMQTVLGAARLLGPECGIGFLFIASGTGAEALGQASRDLGNVRVLGWQPEERMPLIWASAEIALITLRSGLEQCSFPSKTAFALSAGCAIVGLTETPSDLADIIGRKNCGTVIKPGDVDGLVRFLTAMAGDPSRLEEYRARARETAEQYFDRSGNVAALLESVPEF